MGKLIRKIYPAVETKQVDKTRTLLVKISTSNPDRSNDIVVPSGVQLDNYLRNPVVAFGHNYSGLPIAKATQIEILEDAIVAKVEFPKEGTYDFADTVYNLYKDGFMNAWSIGFIPTKWINRSEEDYTGGKEFIEWELLEFSAVIVPDNPEALTIMRSAGVDIAKVKQVMKDFKEEEEVEVKEGEEEAEETPEQPEEAPEAEEEKEVEKVEEKARILFEEHKETIVVLEDSKEVTLLELKEAYEAKNAQANEPVSTEEAQVVIPLKEALVIVDQVVGKALRDLKRGKSSTVQADDESRFVPIVSRTEGSEK